ncbi:hypothetical protein FS749_003665 [Ceratobasidium sp. UAMH 11750]|nr:hypothetical protein FS749_003665 [Ceratobasidium sp. UAMH 11750]
MDTDPVEQLPRYKGRRPINILLVANPDHENDSLQVPETPPRHQSGPASASTSSRVPADPPLTSPASGSGNSPRLELNPPSFTLNHGLLPLDPAVTTRPNRVTSDSEPVVKEGINLPGLRIVSTHSHHARRASDSAVAMQSSNTNRSFSPPPRHALSVSHTPSERVIVSVTRDAQNYITVDITDHMSEARAIRKCLLSKPFPKISILALRSIVQPSINSPATITSMMTSSLLTATALATVRAHSSSLCNVLALRLGPALCLPFHPWHNLSNPYE